MVEILSLKGFDRFEFLLYFFTFSNIMKLPWARYGSLQRERERERERERALILTARNRVHDDLAANHIIMSCVATR